MTISRRALLKLGGACVAATSFHASSSTSVADGIAPASALPDLLHPIQEIDTSGARAVAPFVLDAAQYLAIPQLAQDIDGQPADMNGGDSDVSLIVYRRHVSDLRRHGCGRLLDRRSDECGDR
jgi:hypothetical protein